MMLPQSAQNDDPKRSLLPNSVSENRAKKPTAIASSFSPGFPLGVSTTEPASRYIIRRVNRERIARDKTLSYHLETSRQIPRILPGPPRLTILKPEGNNVQCPIQSD